MKQGNFFLLLIIPAVIFAEELHVIVKFKQEVNSNIINDQIVPDHNGIGSINDRFCFEKMEPVYNRSGMKDKDYGLSRIYIIKLACATDTASVIERYMETGLFDYVELNHAYTNQACFQPTQVFPNDPYMMWQWSFHNTGTDNTLVTREDIDIDMPEAWEIEQGDSSVIVAILDSGIKNWHGEFDGRLWANKEEIPNNGIDDDGNGYVDDKNGWNFVDGNGDIEDDNGHGTAVASIIGSNTNNGVGMAGLNKSCKVMVLKVADSNGLALVSNAATAIQYAVTKGAHVINLSMALPEYSQFYHEVIRYAIANRTLICAAVGNQNQPNIRYPAKFEGVVAVGATNALDSRWVLENDSTYGSNYGDSLDVVAPGDSIVTLHYSNGMYLRRNGTSLSTAFVSGLASLLISQNPDITPEQVRHIITTTAEDQVGDPAEDTPGYDIYYGHGRINAHQALLLGKEMMGTPERGRPSNIAANASLSSSVSWSRRMNRLTITNPILRQTATADFMLVNAAGKVVYENDFVGQAGSITIGLPDLAGGMYVYRVKTRNGALTGKILR